MEAKEQVIERFLQFVSRRVSLQQARLATLGGLGLEAKAWTNAGIPPEHGSLIEIDSTLARSLIKQYRYRTHDRLSAFHQVLSNYRETVDGFHLDLCGTVSSQVTGDFVPTLPYILQSTGRCLAITVADARRNRALSHWPAVRQQGKEFFGRRYPSLFQELESLQRLIPIKKDPKLPAFFRNGFDPHKGAKREYGLLVEVAEMLCRHKCTLQDMERYVYVSRYHDRPFRMRTYFLYFGQGGSKDPRLVLAQRWASSPLFFSDGGEFVAINPAATAASTPKEKVGMKSKLAQVVALIGGEAQAEYEELLADREQLQSIRSALNGGVGAPGKAKNGAHVVQKRKWTDLSPKEQLEFRLMTLTRRTQHMSTGSYYDWNTRVFPELIRESFGRVPKNFSKSLGAMTARMGGKFRAGFIENVKQVLDPDEAKAYIERLNVLPKEAVK